MQAIDYNDAVDLLEHGRVKQVTVMTSEVGADEATGFIFDVCMNNGDTVQLIAEAEQADNYPVMCFKQR